MKIKQIIPADGWRALYVTRDDNYIPDMVEFPLTFWALTDEGVVGYEGRPTPHPVGEDRDDFICYLEGVMNLLRSGLLMRKRGTVR